MARIELADLHHLAPIAAGVEADLFARRRDGSGRYAGRPLCRALCQGAALHYVEHKNGVNDFDVWSFYGAAPPTSGARSTAAVPATRAAARAAARICCAGHARPC